MVHHLGLALLTLSWDKNWDSHSPMNGYPSFYPRIALVAPSPVWHQAIIWKMLTLLDSIEETNKQHFGKFALSEIQCDTFRLEKDNGNFADIFKCIVLKENVVLRFKFSCNLFPRMKLTISLVIICSSNSLMLNRQQVIIRTHDTQFSDTYMLHLASMFNTLKLRQNGCHLADNIFKYIFLKENVWIWLKISQKFVTQVRINNIPALLQIMAWCWPGNKPLSEPVMVSLLKYICVTLPQCLSNSRWQ